MPTEFLPVVAIGGSPAGLGSRETGLASTLAKRLCSEFGFALVEPSKVVEECLTLARKEEQEPEWPILARMHQIGKSILGQLQSDGSAETSVPHSLYAEMMFRKIELLSAPPPKPVIEE